MTKFFAASTVVKKVKRVARGVARVVARVSSSKKPKVNVLVKERNKNPIVEMTESSVEAVEAPIEIAPVEASSALAQVPAQETPAAEEPLSSVSQVDEKQIEEHSASPSLQALADGEWEQFKDLDLRSFEEFGGSPYLKGALKFLGATALFTDIRDCLADLQRVIKSAERKSWSVEQRQVLGTMARASETFLKGDFKYWA
jgi:hypothetical protein